MVPSGSIPMIVRMAMEGPGQSGAPLVRLPGSVGPASAVLPKHGFAGVRPVAFFGTG